MDMDSTTNVQAMRELMAPTIIVIDDNSDEINFSIVIAFLRGGNQLFNSNSSGSSSKNKLPLSNMINELVHIKLSTNLINDEFHLVPVSWGVVCAKLP